MFRLCLALEAKLAGIFQSRSRSPGYPEDRFCPEKAHEVTDKSIFMQTNIQIKHFLKKKSTLKVVLHNEI